MRLDDPPPLKTASLPVDSPRMLPSRQCRTCAGELLATARICPRCGLPQPRRSPISPNLLVGFYAVLSLVALAGILAFLSGGSMFLPGGDFEEHVAEILVADSTFDVSSDHGEPSVATVGRLKNTGSIDWKNVLFEVRYFDADGHLIDTESAQASSLVLPAGGETDFRIEGAAARPANQYASHEVVIRHAEELAGWP